MEETNLENVNSEKEKHPSSYLQEKDSKLVSKTFMFLTVKKLSSFVLENHSWIQLEKNQLRENQETDG